MNDSFKGLKVDFDKYSRFTKMHVGYAFENLLNGIAFVKSDIGSYRTSKKDGKVDLIVSGHRIDGHNENSYILTSLNTFLCMSKKFKTSATGVCVTEVFNEYLDAMYPQDIEENKEYKYKCIEKIKAIDSNKLLPLPFKLMNKYSIDLETNQGLNTFELELVSVIWRTNKETGKLETTLTFVQDYIPNVGKYIKFKYEDYMNKFRPNRNGVYIKEGELNKDLIKITDFGLFKPIEVVDEKNRLIIDNTFIYNVAFGDTTVVGRWTETNQLELFRECSSVSKSKAYKFVQANVGTIGLHRKYIIPYTLYDTNIVETKDI